jgi:hypothetical protein
MKDSGKSCRAGTRIEKAYAIGKKIENERFTKATFCNLISGGGEPAVRPT